jgi:hypothetical protein
MHDAAKAGRVSAFADERQSALPFGCTASWDIEAVADELVALVEELEAAMSEGRLPSDLAERLGRLRMIAERLIDP